ncbi:hypothetical protein FOA52_006576 [Chlamydomonas sp. UWO 241]|nr:hypothetical protein FOA52_006576 [Chlamydomonas sp. UWO 241]
MAGSDVEANGSQPQPPIKQLRVYEQWEGNEVFFLGGRVIAGPNWRASLGTASLVLVPAGVFLAWPCWYLGQHVSWAIFVFGIILPLTSMVFLASTALSDPGIIPRREPDDEYLSGRKPRTQEVHVNGQRVVVRYNDTCHFYQPPRAHHCSVNDNCIERFDHHCPWVGTTIGQRNYRSFLLFVYTTTVLCLFVMACCISQLFVRKQQIEDEKGPGDSAWGSVIIFCIPGLVILGITFVFTFFVGGLAGFHAYLVATNQTTYENFRYNNDDRRNPYDKGVWGNLAEVWCSRTPPPKIDFRALGPARLPAERPSEEEADPEGGGAGAVTHSVFGSTYAESTVYTHDHRDVNNSVYSGVSVPYADNSRHNPAGGSAGVGGGNSAHGPRPGAAAGSSNTKLNPVGAPPNGFSGGGVGVGAAAVSGGAAAALLSHGHDAAADPGDIQLAEHTGGVNGGPDYTTEEEDGEEDTDWRSEGGGGGVNGGPASALEDGDEEDTAWCSEGGGDLPPLPISPPAAAPASSSAAAIAAAIAAGSGLSQAFGSASVMRAAAAATAWRDAADAPTEGLSSGGGGDAGVGDDGQDGNGGGDGGESETSWGVGEAAEGRPGALAG